MNRNKHFAVWIGFLLLVFTLPIYGQKEATTLYGGPPDPEELALNQAGISGLGLTVIDGAPYYRTQLQPDIDLGKVGFGLDIVLLYTPNPGIDEEGNEKPKIRAEDGEEWDNLSTFLRTIRYVRYGHLRDAFYARFGELDYVTIGHGFIMSGYSNYDRRGLRLNVSTKSKKFGVETMVNNLGRPVVFGGRAYFRPLQRGGNSSFLRRLEIGGTYLTDIEPNLIPDQKGVGATINEDPMIALGGDVGIPIIDNRLLRLDLYDDLAFLNRKKAETKEASEDIVKGNAVGLGLSILNALFKVEYRTFEEGFLPTVFDYTYESVKGGTPILAVPQEPEEKGQAKHGFFSMLAWRPVPKVHLLGTFEDYNNSKPRLYAGVTESGVVPQVSFRAFYTKRDIGEPYEIADPDNPGQRKIKNPNFFKDLFRLDEKSAFTVRIGYQVHPRFPLEVAIIREYRFQQVEVDGETGFKPIHKTSFELGFNLNFNR